MAVKDLVFRDFGGGVNLRDAASELSPNEFPFSENVTIDERGYVQKRLGYEDRFGSQVGTGVVSNLFYWATKDWVVEQIGSALHVNNNASFKTFTTSERCGMCEFGGSLFFTHPTDGAFLYDGTTVTAVPSAPKGNTCGVWQNRVWSNDVLNNARLYKSNLVNASVWTSTDYNDLREKDTNKITMITGASGLDIAGRPGLLVFKEDSAYRVNDPATIAYQTIDPSIGCASNIGAVNAYGRTYVISTRGIYSTDGLDPCREESVLLETLFNKLIINQTLPNLYAAGRYQDRLYFSVPKVGATANGISIEYHPAGKWMVLHTNAASAYASLGRGVTDMVFGSPTIQGRIYNHNKGGTDAGAAITSKFQTRWAEPNEGRLTRLRNCKVVGRGTYSLDVFKDYQDSASGAALPVSISPGGFIWDDPGALWDASTTLWGPTFFQGYQEFWSIGTARAVSVYITETSSGSIAGRLVGGVSLEQGNWFMAYVSFMAIDLGMR